MDGHSDEQAASPLWQYALRVYAMPGVAAACLQAQDGYGVDVNLLLTAAWCASGGIHLDEQRLAELDEGCRSWREQVIAALRRQRRAWKDDPRRGEDYAALKHLELAAEREQLQRLERAIRKPPARAGAAGRDTDSNADILRANLTRVCDYFGAPAAAAAGLADALRARGQSAARKPPDW